MWHKDFSDMGPPLNEEVEKKCSIAIIPIHKIGFIIEICESLSQFISISDLSKAFFFYLLPLTPLYPSAERMMMEKETTVNINTSTIQAR
jgi:hypothetical protein